MIYLGFTVVIIVLILIFLRIRKKKLATAPNSTPPIKQESKPADKLVEPAPPSVEKSAPVQVDKPASPVEAENKPTVAKVTSSIPTLPEDSMLRRHYLTQLYAQVAAKLPPRPTDSMLRRHYDTMLENEVKNQLNNTQ